MTEVPEYLPRPKREANLYARGLITRLYRSAHAQRKGDPRIKVYVGGELKDKSGLPSAYFGVWNRLESQEFGDPRSFVRLVHRSTPTAEKILFVDPSGEEILLGQMTADQTSLPIHEVDRILTYVQAGIEEAKVGDFAHRPKRQREWLEKLRRLNVPSAEAV